jgi:hypothetical protein
MCRSRFSAVIVLLLLTGWAACLQGCQSPAPAQPTPSLTPEATKTLPATQTPPATQTAQATQAPTAIQAAASTQDLPVKQYIPILQLPPAGRIVPMTQIVPITQIVPVTQIVQMTEIVVVTQVVQILVEEPPAIPVPAPTEAPMPTAVPQAIPVTVIPIQSLPPNQGLIFGIGQALYWMGLDGAGGAIQIAWMPEYREFISIDAFRRQLYLIQWDANRAILRINLDNMADAHLLNAPLSGGQGLALDIDENRLFLGLYYDGVFSAPLEPCCDGWQQLVTPGQLSPTYGQRGQLQIDHHRQQIYFRSTYNNDCPECRWIWRVNYDGSNLKAILRANGGDALALDTVQRKMYFSDIPYDINTIKRANLDGTEEEILLNLADPYVYCRAMDIDTEHGRLYLSLYGMPNANRRAIASMNLDGSDFRILFDISGDTADSVSGGLALYMNR